MKETRTTAPASSREGAGSNPARGAAVARPPYVWHAQRRST
jgi:hypothetical protein